MELVVEYNNNNNNEVYSFMLTFKVSHLLIKFPQFMDSADLILHNDEYLILYNI